MSCQRSRHSRPLRPGTCAFTVVLGAASLVFIPCVFFTYRQFERACGFSPTFSVERECPVDWPAHRSVPPWFLAFADYLFFVGVLIAPLFVPVVTGTEVRLQIAVTPRGGRAA